MEQHMQDQNRLHILLAAPLALWSRFREALLAEVQQRSNGDDHGQSGCNPLATCPMDDLALIYEQLKDLPDVLATRSTCKHLCDGPAADRVATLQVPEDCELPGRAWQRFPCADGLLVRLPQSEQHWERAVAEMPDRARRLTVEQEVPQQVEEQQEQGQEQLQGQQQGQQQRQQGQPPNSIGSVLLRALPAAACTWLLQQLTLHAPITTADVSQVLGLLPALQHLELHRLIEQRGWKQQLEEGPWDLPAAGRGVGGLKHLLLQADLQECQGVLLLLPGSGARLQSLRLLEGVFVANGTAISRFTNLQTLEVYSKATVQQDGSLSHFGATEEQMAAVLGPLQQLQELYLHAFELCLHQDTKVGQLFAGLQHLRQLRLGYMSISNGEPKVMLPGVTELRLLGLTTCTGYGRRSRRIMMPDEARGWITKALPALQVFSSSGQCTMDECSFLAAFAGHAALRSLSVTIGGYVGEEAVDELASIPCLEDLELLDVSREQVLDRLQQLRACSKLRRLHLKGAHMRVSHRLPTVHLGPWQMDEEDRMRLRVLQAAALGAGCSVTVTGLAGEMDG